MKFTVIMQSLISEYPNSARNKETKLLRAVNSVLSQTFQDFELLIIADNCQKTVDIIQQNYDLTEQLRLINNKRERTRAWSAECRNVGIENSKGKYILYLDIDDYYNREYLQELDDLITNKNLYFADDIVFNKDVPVQRRCNIKPFMCGTSNIIHKKGRSRWQNLARYGHEDWQFIQALINEYKDYEQLNIAGYVVAHIPAKYDK
jgi:glycosyltransferase involved in cell wall biosynthesis